MGSNNSSWENATTAAHAAAGAPSVERASATFDHVLLAVVDPNPYLSSGTKAACAAAAAHALSAGAGAKLTVLVADAAPLPPGADPAVRAETVTWHLAEAGWKPGDGSVPLVQRAGENPATAISEAAEDAGAALVVLAAGAVHTKAVDANLLCVRAAAFDCACVCDACADAA